MVQHNPLSADFPANQPAQRNPLGPWLDAVQAALPSGLDAGAQDAQSWRLAAERLQQAAQALEQAGRPAPLQLVRAMEGAARRVAATPELHTAAHANLMQQASAALRSYLAHARPANPEDAVALFPVYKPVAALAAWQRCEPADLWQWQPMPWRPVPASLLPAAEAGNFYDCALHVFRQQEADTLLALADAAGAQATAAVHDAPAATCWQLLTAVLQLRAAGAWPWDTLLQRALSGMVALHARARQGQTIDAAQQQRLARDMLYMLAQGVHLVPAHTQPLAHALAQAYGVLPPPLVVVRVNTGPCRTALYHAVQGLPPEQVKTLGALQLPDTLYNAYLQTADAWSRELVLLLNRWARQPAHPLPQTALALSAQLARASAQIGLDELATLAHALERALTALQQRMAHGEEAQLLHRAATLLRHELHQVAVDAVRTVPFSLLQQLAALSDAPESDRVVLPLPDPPLDTAAPATPASVPRQRLQGDAWRAYLAESAASVQHLRGVLQQWAARPDNAGAGQECMRLLQGLRRSAYEAGAMSVLPLAQAALTEAALLRVRDAAAPERLHPLLRAVEALETGLQQEQAQAAAADQG